jgi:U3 small nucleolar RNA-associated protein 5
LPVLGSADKLAIWDVSADRLLVEWEVEGASKVNCVCWSTVPSSKGQSKRKRQKQGDGPADGDEEVVILTTEKAQAFVFSPKRGVLRKLDMPSPATAVWSSDRGVILASASSVYLLSSDASSIAHTFALPANTPSPTAVAALPTTTADIVRVLVASISVIVLSLNTASGKIAETSSSLPVSTSCVTSIFPLQTSSQGTSFLVVSADDRTVSQYTLPTGQSKMKLSYRYASPTLSPTHSVASSSSHISVLHNSGEISLFPIPKELDFTRPKSDSKPSSVKLVEGKEDRQSRVCRADFAPTGEGEPAALLCARIAGAARVKVYRAVFELPEGGVKPETVFRCEAQDLVASSENKVRYSFYAE